MSSTPMSTADVDVVVIGAGVSGLTAARRLVAAGLEVAVLEARPEVGGRTMLSRIRGITIDRGGQFLCASMHPLLALLDELGMATEPNQSLRDPQARDVWFRDGERSTYVGDLPPLTQQATAALLAAMARLQEMSDTIDLENPWDSPDAVELDETTLGAWLTANVREDEAIYLLTALFSLACVAAPQQLSLLFALWFIKGAGGIEGMGGDVDMTVVGGAGSIGLRLAAELGDRVHRGQPVAAVAHTADGVEVTTRSGAEFRSRRAIFAVPPSDARAIAFHPHLPSARTALQSQWQQHAVLKFHACYDTPFWREDGLNGAVLSDIPVAPIVFDGSPADGSAGILLGFLGLHGPRLFGGNDPALIDDEQRLKSEIVAALTTYFGDRAAEPTEVVVHNWAVEPYISGVLGATPPGLLSAYGDALRTPVGPLHWAGTETALRWSGWISGAVEAGERAAHEVAAVLRPG
ncbi:flavin monoamine oxidase family protein [Nocardia mexicana]|uniref:Monoamine oxidase n=1 Tax=Nocardia mexicana TaxID=279262 RepID=A0A370H0L5_9NOCA|nr:FAD-dependent oxidoreductase [Nocardia mexicana]RDI49428.1 monoamine oxidase [Nocardia mexicana]